VKPSRCTPGLRLHHVISLLLLLRLHQSHAASSPIRNLESSLTASSSHGTIIAITCTMGDNCQTDNADSSVLMLARTPTIRSKLNPPVTRNIECKQHCMSDDNYRVIGVGPTSSGMLHMLHTGSAAPLAIGLTGLSSDVRHLVRCCANVVSQHDMIFDNACNSGSSIEGLYVSGYKLVEYLAGRMSNVARISGARPFGVQALVVGRSITASSNTVKLGRNSSINKLSIYTVDPSGGWRKWNGGAAVIGKYSGPVRARLRKYICGDDDAADAISNRRKENDDDDDDDEVFVDDNNNEGDDTADNEVSIKGKQKQEQVRGVEEALRIAIQSFLDATVEHERYGDASAGSDQFEAILISCASDAYGCRSISEARVREIYGQCLTNCKVNS